MSPRLRSQRPPRGNVTYRVEFLAKSSSARYIRGNRVNDCDETEYPVKHSEDLRRRWRLADVCAMRQAWPGSLSFGRLTVTLTFSTCTVGFAHDPDAPCRAEQRWSARTDRLAPGPSSANSRSRV